jgi:hypothetical protein
MSTLSIANLVALGLLVLALIRDSYVARRVGLK